MPLRVVKCCSCRDLLHHHHYRRPRNCCHRCKRIEPYRGFPDHLPRRRMQYLSGGRTRSKKGRKRIDATLARLACKAVARPSSLRLAALLVGRLPEGMQRQGAERHSWDDAKRRQMVLDPEGTLQDSVQARNLALLPVLALHLALVVPVHACRSHVHLPRCSTSVAALLDVRIPLTAQHTVDSFVGGPHASGCHTGLPQVEAVVLRHDGQAAPTALLAWQSGAQRYSHTLLSACPDLHRRVAS
ncbi:hypothetical protein K437DRAFT_15905 [Tilletiaria anomala UBC 951]|uniref:Uncharacterized protein n=1 Tax=Tilletiaria anomala (strain ATCC 24038 / CBS 436.72 / UBC 951) TaxID=1037660 RepID=A0A066WEF0_TILAU|nr:uncharacterized protein K437DRAFT_15905 [Tilletiaria anomala UBC 951]KDN52317.1 hypothetical protein K437DRAFT_15905 [Tilletiaria anomala UBC 951]